VGPPTRCASDKSRSREVESKITGTLGREEQYFLRKYFDTRTLSQIAVFASLYTVLVWLLPGLSFAAVQFRIAEGLKPAIAKRWTLAFAFALGNFLGNLISPFAGIYELGFMPLMNIVGGLLAYGVARAFKRNYLVAGLVYAAVIGLSVSWMLHILFNIPLEALVPLLIASEETVMIIGAVLFYLVEKRWKWYQ
jgi:uncharacterized membrane protein